MKRYVVAIYNPDTDINSIQVLTAETPAVAIVEGMANVIGEVAGVEEEEVTMDLEALTEILHGYDTYTGIKEELESTFSVTISTPLSIHSL